jgi:hypothetical protein
MEHGTQTWWNQAREALNRWALMALLFSMRHVHHAGSSGLRAPT